MKKWENPELMILGVENTKEESKIFDQSELCPKCDHNHGSEDDCCHPPLS